VRTFVVGAGGLSQVPEARAACLAALERGALIVYPTDTLYALGGLALREGVAERVVAAKGREEGKALPVVAADWTQVLALAPLSTKLAQRLAERFWPGPLSLVVNAGPNVPSAVRGGGLTVAVRVPASPLARELCALAGPLVATSANRSGQPAALTCRAAAMAIADSVAVAIDGGDARETRPSTLVDVSGAAPRLLREGAISWSDVLDTLTEAEVR
jgi:L-threonylcarbamoyladenylate synthase